MTKAAKKAPVWTRPELVRLGTLKDVAAKGSTAQDGQSGNFNFVS